jgi:hypothetical protein
MVRQPRSAALEPDVAKAINYQLEVSPNAAETTLDLAGGTYVVMWVVVSDRSEPSIAPADGADPVSPAAAWAPVAGQGADRGSSG